MICNECQHDLAEHRLYGCNAGAEEEAEKAQLFDALAAAVVRKNGHDWAIYRGIRAPVVIYLRGTGEIIHGATMADAVTKALEAEGKR